MQRLFIVLFFIFIGFSCYAPESGSITIVVEPPTVHFTMADVDAILEELDIQYPEIVKAQIILETGWLKSKICHENKNLVGMKLPKSRPTTAKGAKRGHAFYSSFRSCLEDYKIWQDSRYDGSEDYYAFLQRIGYASDTNYINKLKLLT